MTVEMLDIDAMLKSLTSERLNEAVEAADKAVRDAYAEHVQPLSDRAERLRVFRKAARDAETKLARKVDASIAEPDNTSSVLPVPRDADITRAEYAEVTEKIRAYVESRGGSVTPGDVARGTGYSYNLVISRMRRHTELFEATGKLGVPKFALARAKKSRPSVPSPAPAAEAPPKEPTKAIGKDEAEKMLSEMDAFSAVTNYLIASGPQTPESLLKVLSVTEVELMEILTGRSFYRLRSGEYRLRR